MDMPQSLNSNFGKMASRATEASRERSPERVDDLESVASVVEGSDPGASEDCF